MNYLPKNLGLQSYNFYGSKSYFNSKHPHQYVQKNFHFAYLKLTFSILHLFLQNTHINLSIIHIYLNKIFIFLNTVNSNCERREKGKEIEVKRGERKKRIKKSFTQWTVTMYIYTITIHLQDHCAYLDIFTKTDVGGFWIKMCKIEHFLYFRRLSIFLLNINFSFI